MILCINPKINYSIKIKNITLKKITPILINNFFKVNLLFKYSWTICSMSCKSEVIKLSNIFDSNIIFKDDIMKNSAVKMSDNTNNTLIVLGLYSPHHWSKYMKLFDKYENIFIIFTGTDILQLNDVKVTNKQEIIDFLKKRCICGSLNSRNQMEILDLHNLYTNIISLPYKSVVYDNVRSTEKRTKIACYVGSNIEWYSFNTLIELSKIMLDYTFYIYKHDGFTKEFINNNYYDNVIYNTCTIDNIEEFLCDKLCSLRITYHDGEPMTGIESMLLSVPFLFNHDMKYSIKIDNNPINIKKQILMLNEYTEQEYFNIKKYYLNKNSSNIFEKYIKSFEGYRFVKDLSDNVKITCNEEKEVIIDLNKYIDNPYLYRIIINCYKDGNESLIKIENNIIEEFCKTIYLDNTSTIKINIFTLNSCNIYLNKISLYSLN